MYTKLEIKHARCHTFLPAPSYSPHSCSHCICTYICCFCRVHCQVTTILAEAKYYSGDLLWPVSHDMTFMTYDFHDLCHDDLCVGNQEGGVRWQGNSASNHTSLHDSIGADSHRNICANSANEAICTWQPQAVDVQAIFSHSSNNFFSPGVHHMFQE